MSLPSINQVRQLFVALSEKAYSAAISAVGDTKVAAKTRTYTDDEENEVTVLTGPFRITQIGHGGQVSSETIDPKKIASVHLTKAAAMKEKLGVHTVTVTTVSAGQIYEVKLQINQYIGQGEQDQTYRLGTYKAKTGDTAALIAAGLAASLQKALGYDSNLGAASSINSYKEKLCTVTVAGAVITISEVEQDWVLGKFPVAHMPVRVFLNGIFTSDEYETFDWATIAHSVALSGLTTVSKKVADLEFFCHGARGDEYRGVGYPRNIDTKYMVNPESATAYDLLDIHFFYQGSNEAVQKSEKDLTIVLPAGDSHQIVTDLTPILAEAGLSVEVTSA